MTARATFKQDDIKRAVKGCLSAGMAIGTVAVSPSGEILIYAKGDEAAPRRNPLDRLLENGR